MTTSDVAFLRKLAEIKRTGQFKISMEQLRRLDHIKQGQFTATITEEDFAAMGTDSVESAGPAAAGTAAVPAAVP